MGNAQVRWITDGVEIVDEVLIFESADTGKRPVQRLTQEDEGIFRSAMTRREESVNDLEPEGHETEGVGAEVKPDVASESGA